MCCIAQCTPHHYQAVHWLEQSLRLSLSLSLSPPLSRSRLASSTPPRPASCCPDSASSSPPTRRQPHPPTWSRLPLRPRTLDSAPSPLKPRLPSFPNMGSPRSTEARDNAPAVVCRTTKHPPLPTHIGGASCYQAQRYRERSLNSFPFLVQNFLFIGFSVSVCVRVCPGACLLK